MLLFLTVALLSIVLLRTCIMKIRIITLSGGAEVDRVLQCKALKKGYFLEAQSRVCMLGVGGHEQMDCRLPGHHLPAAFILLDQSC